MSYKIDRNTYAQTYGPTTGDRVRLADTELFIEVEKDRRRNFYSRQVVLYPFKAHNIAGGLYSKRRKLGVYIQRAPKTLYLFTNL